MPVENSLLLAYCKSAVTDFGNPLEKSWSQMGGKSPKQLKSQLGVDVLHWLKFKTLGLFQQFFF